MENFKGKQWLIPFNSVIMLKYAHALLHVFLKCASFLVITIHLKLIYVVEHERLAKCILSSRNIFLCFNVPLYVLMSDMHLMMSVWGCLFSNFTVFVRYFFLPILESACTNEGHLKKAWLIDCFRQICVHPTRSTNFTNFCSFFSLN